MTRLAPGAILRMSALALGTLALLPVQLLVVRLIPSRGAAIPRLFHRLTCRMLGVRRRVRGTPPPPGSRGGQGGGLRALRAYRSNCADSSKVRAAAAVLTVSKVLLDSQ